MPFVPQINLHNAKYQALVKQCDNLKAAIEPDLSNISFKLCANGLIPPYVRDKGEASLVVSAVEHQLKIDEMTWVKLLKVLKEVNLGVIAEQLVRQLEENIRQAGC